MFRKIFLLFLVILSIVFAVVAYHSYSTQPVEVSALQPTPTKTIKALPKRNQEVIEYIENQGKTLAPTYHNVVCTDYVIKVLSHFYKLSKQEKRAIQIITESDLKLLINNDEDIIKGVYNALITSGKGIAIAENNVQPGDFVQFWNIVGNSCYGHCGIVKTIDNETITMYSSHPITDGFGIHTFRYPDKAYFVRLK